MSTLDRNKARELAAELIAKNAPGGSTLLAALDALAEVERERDEARMDAMNESIAREFTEMETTTARAQLAVVHALADWLDREASKPILRRIAAVRLRAALANPAGKGDGQHEVCKYCKCEMDLDVCWCGDGAKGHGSIMDAGHSFVPAGCRCGFLAGKGDGQ